MGASIQQLKRLYNEGSYEEVSKQLCTIDFERLSIAERSLYYRLLIGLQINLEQRIDHEAFVKYEQLIEDEADEMNICIFENSKGLKYLFEGNFELAVDQFSKIIAEDRHMLQRHPTLYATALGNCIYALISMKQYRRAILLYNSINDTNLTYLLREAPRTYFHVHENLLDAYIGMEQWQTGMTIAETILSLNELEQNERYKAIIQMAAGYILSKVDLEKGKALCLEAATYFDFTKNRRDYNLAYDRLMHVLMQDGDEKLIAHYAQFIR